MDEQEATAPASNGEARTVEAPVVRVELFEDRAAITRRFEVPEAGRHRLQLGPLSPLVSDHRVSFPSAGEGVVVEEAHVRLRPAPAEPADPEAIEALTEQLQQARDARERAADRVRRAREAHLRARQATTSASEATVQALQAQDDVVAWAKAVQVVSRREGAAIRRVAEAEIELARLTEAETQLARDLDRLRGVAPDAGDDPSTSEVIDGVEQGTAQKLEGWLEVSVFATGPAEQQVRYVVPCALWRPTHRARCAGASSEGADSEGDAPDDQVKWETWGACWNATGEDWHGVQVICSTARDGERARPPSIQDDVIRVQDGQPLPEALPDDPSDEVAAFAHEREIHHAADLPGIDDGGRPRAFTVEGTVDLPSDGRVTEVMLETWSTEAITGWRATPEHASLVVRRTRQAIVSGGALLAGPVDLVRGDAYIGRASVPLVAEGASFTLDWGSHPDIRLERRRSHQIERQKATGTLTHEFRVELELSHAGDAPCTVEVHERVPISEYADVFVTGPESDPPLSQDMTDDGFCVWSVALEPHSSRAMSLFYTVRAAADAELPFQGP